MKLRYAVILFLLVVILVMPVFPEAGESKTDELPYTAYRGHGRDADLLNAISVYPGISGKALDDCRLCHLTAFEAKNPSGACDTCHRIMEAPERSTTLNPYGIAYRDAGRNRKALTAVAEKDSDGDGLSNANEILKGSFPGEKDHLPGMKPAPMVILTPEKLKDLPGFEQFIMLNTHKHQDEYALYSGWLITDILQAAGADLTATTGISVISWDSFRKDFSIADIQFEYPAPNFFGNYNNPEFLKGCEPWVKYPSPLPEGVTDGKPIPGSFRLMLAGMRDGKEMVPERRNAHGKLTGEGGYRLIAPQKVPGRPDQIQMISDAKYPSPFDGNLDHNSGYCARVVIGIQVYPIPAGTDAPDWRAMADDLYFGKNLIVFGNLEEGIGDFN